MKRCEKCDWRVVPILRKNGVFCRMYGNVEELQECPAFDDEEEKGG